MITRGGEIEAEREQQILFENPPIAETEEARILNAISYNKERGWPQDLAAKKAGICRGKLQR
jgi:hypothetical protein